MLRLQSYTAAPSFHRDATALNSGPHICMNTLLMSHPQTRFSFTALTANLKNVHIGAKHLALITSWFANRILHTYNQGLLVLLPACLNRLKRVKRQNNISGVCLVDRIFSLFPSLPLSLPL